MRKLERLMVALDMSSLDERLLAYTNFFAHAAKARTVMGVHVIPVMLVADTIKVELDHIFSPAAPAVGLIEQEMEKKVEQWIEGNQIERKIIVLEGRPHALLLDLAEQSQTDLIIFGRKKISSGSGVIAKRTARQAKSDLLFVPESARPEIKRILVAMDFSQSAADGLQQALYLSESLGLTGKVDCVHVVDSAVFKWPDGEASFRKLNPEELPEDVQQKLDMFRSIHLVDESRVGFTFVKSRDHHIADSVKTYALNTDADLIIIGAVGHSILENFLFGSVAEAMVNGFFDRPVYIVRKGA